MVEACRIIRQGGSLRLTGAWISSIIMPTGKVVPPTLPYNTAGLILKGKHMQATIDSTLSALLHSAEVKKNIEAEALRKAKVEQQIVRAMDRANREWR